MTPSEPLNNSNKIRVLIVDTSVLDRDLIKKALSGAGDIQVVSAATDGKVGKIKAIELKPDIILIDMGIKDFTPIQLIQELRNEINQLGFIATTAHSPGPQIVQKTIDSLQCGVFDFVEKPSFLNESESINYLKRKLLPKIRSLSIQRYSRIAKGIEINRENGHSEGNKSFPVDNEKIIIKFDKDINSGKKAEIIAIGVSTGGPEALSEIIPALPSTLPLPIVIVLHMPENFTGIMADSLDRKSNLNVKEAAVNEDLKPGFVYLSRGDKHLIIRKKAGKPAFIDYDDGPELHGCKPSVDVMFNSISDSIGGNAIAVILTGMGEDGVENIGKLKKQGAVTIAQDKNSSIVWGMPGMAVKAGFIDEVLPLNGIAGRIIDLCNKILS